AQGMPWRTEPEIGDERQQFLTRRRAITPEIETDTYPFRDVALCRADVEWLLATHEAGGRRGPVDAKLTGPERRDGLDLRGANLRDADLTFLPMACTIGGLSLDEQLPNPEELPRRIEAAAVHMEGARLRNTDLRAAPMRGAHLEGAYLRYAHLEGTRLQGAHLQGANLVRAWFIRDNNLEGLSLGDANHGYATLVDVEWGGVNLAVVDWSQMKMLGDEQAARQSPSVRGDPASKVKRLNQYMAAVRANRQLATLLRAQTLNEDADRFFYRSQLLQRRVLRLQGHYARAFGSWLLGLIAGYGYKPLRSVITYLLVVGAFAVAYFLLGGTVHPPLGLLGSMVFSITSFHGRGFAPGENVLITNPLTIIAAVEAIIGLLIEITFIATFTQRFFAR
ncbi:MAG: pentapeptide repeat-containing protein, partial [Ktedonobacterales bacterium]